MSREEEKRKVLLGITGSIAAYKAAELARILVKKGYIVRVIMTESATKFITPLTFEAITGNKVVTSFWESNVPQIEHIELADWCDTVIVAPATAEFISSFASGRGDSPLLATLLATKSPVVVAPAMNVNMYTNPFVQENISKLLSMKVTIVDPEAGSLACGWTGIGRLAEPVEIYQFVRRSISKKDFVGKKVVITTGPTREAIDPVRFISNRSSGKMGVSLAKEAFRRGAEVTLIHGPIHIRIPDAINSIQVMTCQQMHKSLTDIVKQNDADIVIMAAAVADVKPKDPHDIKIKKDKLPKAIELEYNPDILADVGGLRGENSNPKLVGFAVETGELEDLLAEIKRKLISKNVDIMVGNFANDAFDLDTNRVWIIDKYGKQEEVSTSFKDRVANKILDAILKI